MDTNIDSHEYSAREYVGCVSDNDVRGLLSGDGQDQLKYPGSREAYYPEEREAWHHFTAGCICRELHAECDFLHCPKQNEEVPPLSTAKAGPQKLDLLIGVTFHQLRDAGRAGCWFCAILCDGVEGGLERAPLDAQRRNWHEQLRIMAENRKGKGDGRPFLCVTLIFPGEEIDDAPSYEFYKPVGLDNSDVCACFRTAPEIPVSTALKESFIFAKSQMSACIRSKGGSHANCEVGEVTLPTRVLEIMVLDGRYSVRLLVTNGLKGRYFTLSHCWGTKIHATTTSVNLRDRQVGIPWACLSRTFRDAIHITHRLGFRFLWIDALCITQDDKLDWQRESSQMHVVYRDCSLMIGADKARDGDGGCFSNGLRDSWPVKDEYHRTRISARQTRHHPGIIKMKRTEKFAALAPLGGRAWAFQERTLAPRILHYSVDELIWECGGMYKCQCGHVEQFMTHTSPKKFLFGNCTLNDKIIESYWAGLIADYSGRCLTIPQDRLPAFSGLAKSFEDMWNRLIDDQSMPVTPGIEAVQTSNLTETQVGSSRETRPKSLGMYLAGLWYNYLDFTLIWTRPFPDSILISKPNEYIAPSWSWASINSTVQFFESRAKLRNISIIGASCTPAGLHPKGVVNEGHLIIAGPVVKLSLSRSRPFSSQSNHSWGFYSVHDYSGCDVTGNYMPDYMLEEGESGLTIGERLTVYGLALSPDFVMVLKLLMPGIYERIGTLTFLPCPEFKLHAQPSKWNRDAIGMTMKIV